MSLFKGNAWTINEERNAQNKVAFTRDFKNFDISEFVLNHFEERLELSGVIKDTGL